MKQKKQKRDGDRIPFRYSKKQQRFWAETKTLLSQADSFLRRAKKFFAEANRKVVRRLTSAVLLMKHKHDVNAERAFWTGEFPKALQEELPEPLASQSPKQIVELCQVVLSKDDARSWIISRATHEKIIGKWTEAGTTIGGKWRVNDKHYARRYVESSGSLSGGGVPEIIHRAACENDRSFFLRLRDILADKEKLGKLPQPDWLLCDTIAVFLAEYWCGGNGHYFIEFWHGSGRQHVGSLWNLPPLCIFTDQALADLCQLVFPTAQPSLLSVRKWRQRLGQKQLKLPKIKAVSVKGGEILFT